MKLFFIVKDLLFSYEGVIEMSKLIQGMPKINKNSPLPLYYQLKREIINLINKEKLKTGDKIPSEREICKYHGISRMTVHKAIKELVQENYLYREQGKGTFVAEDINPTIISPLSSFTSEMNKQGKSPLTHLKNWEIISASKFMARKLDIKENEKIFKMERLRIIKDKPFIWEQVHIPYNKCSDLKKSEVENQSLYKLLKDKYYFNLNYAEATVEPVLLDSKIASLLKVGKNTMGLLFNQTTYLDAGEPIEYTIAYYQSEQYKFKFRFGQNIN